MAFLTEWGEVPTRKKEGTWIAVSADRRMWVWESPRHKWWGAGLPTDGCKPPTAQRGSAARVPGWLQVGSYRHQVRDVRRCYVAVILSAKQRFAEAEHAESRAM